MVALPSTSIETFNSEERQLLKQIARIAIAEGLAISKFTPTTCAPKLLEPRASFVTLQLNGDLRGCVGSLVAHQSLYEDVQHNAKAAAFDDSRFSPVNREEFERLEIKISVLSPTEKIVVQSETELLQALTPHVHGLILQEGHHCATFLPAVWESLTTPKDFVNHLKLKAGLPVKYWSHQLEFLRYTVEQI